MRSDTATVFCSKMTRGAAKSLELLMPPREARSFSVPVGHFFRICSTGGPQVGDLNLWHTNNLSERFCFSKTRALHGSHLSIGDRLWTSSPLLRPMATIPAAIATWVGRWRFNPTW